MLWNHQAIRINQNLLKHSMKPLKLTFLLPAVLISILMTSCFNETTVYHQYHHVSTKGWKQSDTLSFAIADSIAGHRYALEIGIRHTEMYPYQNIWIVLLHHTDSIAADTFQLELASPQGEWKGKGNASKLYQYIQTTGEINLTPTDTLLQLIHIMKDSCLNGITDAGIRLSLTGGINTQENK